MIRLKIITIASVTLHLVHYPLKKKTFLLRLKYLTARENLKALLNIFSKLIPHTWKQQITKSYYLSHTEKEGTREGPNVRCAVARLTSDVGFPAAKHFGKSREMRSWRSSEEETKSKDD